MTELRQRQPRQRNEQHLRWLRTLECLVSGSRQKVEAAHVRFDDPVLGKRQTGIGERPDDRWALPLARDIHADQHRHGEREWWARQGIDPLRIAQQLYCVSGDTEAGETVIRMARLTVSTETSGT